MSIVSMVVKKVPPGSRFLVIDFSSFRLRRSRFASMNRYVIVV